MSKDKHKGVERRKFVMANLPIMENGKKIKTNGYRPDPNTDYRYSYGPEIDITKDVKALKKKKMLKFKRTGLRKAARTLLIPKDE